MFISDVELLHLQKNYINVIKDLYDLLCIIQSLQDEKENVHINEKTEEKQRRNQQENQRYNQAQHGYL